MSTDPLHIYVSRTTLDEFGPLLRESCQPGGAVRFIPHDGSWRADPGVVAKVRIAFVSTELRPTAEARDETQDLPSFYDALLACPALEWLHVCSAGTDRPIYAELARRGVTITNSSGANALSVAHTALAGMLALARDVPMWVTRQAERRWQEQRHEVSCADMDGGKAVILGTGPIGREIALLCKAFGMRTVGIRRSRVPVDGFDEVHSYADLPDVIGDAAWLIAACPLTDETRHLIDARLLARLPAYARVVNISRGAVMDEVALAQALHDGALAGAYSDVFSTEPLPVSSPLWDAPGFLLSAHSAGASQNYRRRATELFANNLRRWFAKEPLANVASLAKG